MKDIIETCPLAYERFVSALYRLIERVYLYKNGTREDTIEDLEKRLADALKFDNYVENPRKFPDPDSPVAKRQRA